VSTYFEFYLRYSGVDDEKEKVSSAFWGSFKKRLWEFATVLLSKGNLMKKV